MLQPVEVLHDGRWLAATMMATRRDNDGWHGLVGYVDPLTREGFYRWCPEALLRDPPVSVGLGATEPGAVQGTADPMP